MIVKSHDGDDSPTNWRARRVFTDLIWLWRDHRAVGRTDL